MTFPQPTPWESSSRDCVCVPWRPNVDKPRLPGFPWTVALTTIFMLTTLGVCSPQQKLRRLLSKTVPSLKSPESKNLRPRGNNRPAIASRIDPSDLIPVNKVPNPFRPPETPTGPGSSTNFTFAAESYRPECAEPDDTWCDSDPKYPDFEIRRAARIHRLSFLDLYADVANLSPENSVLNTNTLDDEQYACDTIVLYAKPRRAINATGSWNIIVNDVQIDSNVLTQSVRIEICESMDNCNFVPDCYNTTCVQLSMYHRMLVYDPFDIYFPFAINLFKFPSSCSCFADAFYVEN